MARGAISPRGAPSDISARFGPIGIGHAAARALREGEVFVMLPVESSGDAAHASIALCRDASLAAQLGLDAGARVLVVNTEGDTAPAVYEALVGDSGDALRERQARRLKAAR